MTEGISDHLAGRPETEFPTPTFPTVFADGVSGYLPSAQVVKFFLYRIDPNVYGRAGFKSNPFAQVVMPTWGFAQTAALFQHAIGRLIAAGYVKQEDYNQMVAGVADLNRPPEGTPNA